MTVYTNSFQLGTPFFQILVLLVSCGVVGHLSYGFGTKKSNKLIVLLVLLLMIGTQLYFVLQSVCYIPSTRFYVYNVRKFTINDYFDER